MKRELDKNRPICPQICEILCVDMANGTLKSRQKIPSVRELALLFGVNPNTVQKAFEQLEQMGLIYSVRGSGWYVEDNTNKSHDILDSFAKEKKKVYIDQMQSLGFDKDAVLNYIKERME